MYFEQEGKASAIGNLERGAQLQPQPSRIQRKYELGAEAQQARVPKGYHVKFSHNHCVHTQIRTSFLFCLFYFISFYRNLSM